MTATEDDIKRRKIAEVYEWLGRFYTEEGQRIWMHGRKVRLDEKRPIDLINEPGLEGVQRVLTLLEQMEAGGL